MNDARFFNSIGFLAEHRLNLIAIAQRSARICHYDLAFGQAPQDFGIEVRAKADAHIAGLDDITTDHLHAGAVGPIGNRGTRD